MKMSFQQFRTNALSSRELIPNKSYPNHWSKDDWEKWVKKEYNRHYQTPKKEVQP